MCPLQPGGAMPQGYPGGPAPGQQPMPGYPGGPAPVPNPSMPGYGGGGPSGPSPPAVPAISVRCATNAPTCPVASYSFLSHKADILDQIERKCIFYKGYFWFMFIQLCHMIKPTS